MMPERVRQIRARLGMKEFVGLGDIVAAVATPVARAFGHPCIDEETGQPKPASPCDDMKKKLNKIQI